MTERRNHTRVTVDRAILVQLSSGETVHARMVNLSAGGLCIAYPAPAEPGTTLAMSFLLPDENRELINIHCKATAQYSHVHHEDFITGFEFTELKPEDKTVIEKFIRKKLSSSQQSIIVR